MCILTSNFCILTIQFVELEAGQQVKIHGIHEDDTGGDPG